MITRLTILILIASIVVLYLALTGPKENPTPIINEPTPQEIIAAEREGEEILEAEAEEVSEEETTPTVFFQDIEEGRELHTYIEVINSCGPHFEDDCLVGRSAPSTSASVVTSLRNGVVLKVSDSVENEGRTWYKIEFDEWLRYPGRLPSSWYVAADFVRVFQDSGVTELPEGEKPETNKRIEVVRGEQMLYAYEGDELFMKEPVSTGLNITPTPRGTFTVYRKTPTRYMQGPLPGISDKYFDLPGVSWNLYFTYEGAIVHGTYWHENFGQQWSNGCVNLPTHKAEELYRWADIGTTVIVRD